MMRRLSCLCALTTLILASLSLLTPTSQAQPSLPSSNTRLEWPAHSATPAGRVRVTITKTKPKLHLAKLPRPVARLFLEDGDDDYYDDLPDLQVGYRRPELINQTGEVELSDNIKLRLALARLKALKKYEETWS